MSGSVLSKLINGAAAVLGAALFSQFPAFYQQYLQRLGGGLDQARIAVQRIEEVARSLGLTVDNMVERFMMSRDAAYKSLGVEHDASNDEIKKSYRRLMNRNHPDKIASSNPDAAVLAEAERRTREVRVAYELLKARRAIR